MELQDVSQRTWATRLEFGGNEPPAYHKKPCTRSIAIELFEYTEAEDEDENTHADGFKTSTGNNYPDSCHSRLGHNEDGRDRQINSTYEVEKSNWRREIVSGNNDTSLQ